MAAYAPLCRGRYTKSVAPYAIALLRRWRGAHRDRGTIVAGIIVRRLRARSRGARLAVLVPYLWLAFFFLAPFLIVLKISLSQPAIAQPPYTPVFDISGGWRGFKAFIGALAFENYSFIASDRLYL